MKSLHLHRSKVLRVLELSLLLTTACHDTLSARAESEWWPQFRGAHGSGVSKELPPPTFFGPSSNLLWKVEIPSGNSSPCIWNNKLFLTSFDKKKLETLCLDRSHGQILWRQTAPTQNFEHTHRLGNPATPTPCTDGSRVYVAFGSYGLLAYDFEGHEVWRHPLPPPSVEFGTSTSPILAGGHLIWLVDQDEGSFLIALNPATGKEAWRADRSGFRRGFSTPYVWRTRDGEQLVVPGSIQLKSYDPKTGSEIWTYTGTSRVANTTPIAEGETLIYSSWNVGADASDRVSMPPSAEFFPAHDQNQDGRLAPSEIPSGPVKERFSQMDLNKDGVVTPSEWESMREMFAKAKNQIIALNSGVRGEVDASHVAWTQSRSLPYVSSPLVSRGRVYTMKNGGLASCYDLSTGKVLYQDERVGVGGDYYASAVSDGDRVWIGSESGTMVVLKAGDAFEVVARNALGSPILATPAIVGGVLYVRAGETLFAFGESAKNSVTP